MKISEQFYEYAYIFWQIKMLLEVLQKKVNIND